MDLITPAPARGCNPRPSPPLTIGTWNLGTHGLLHAEDVNDTLSTINLDIIILTETHMVDDPRVQATAAAQLTGYTCHWSACQPTGNRTPRGVCVAVKTNANLQPYQLATPPHLAGSLCAVEIDSARGRLLLLGVYIPDSSSHGAGRSTAHMTGQIDTIKGVGALITELGPHYTGLIMGGDFNFAHTPLDRPHSGLNQKDTVALAAWNGCDLDTVLQDPYRQSTPQGKATTYVHPAHQSPHRLDRFYISHDFGPAPRVRHTQLTVETTGHMLVKLHLPATSPTHISRDAGAYKFLKADLSVRHDKDFSLKSTALAKVAPRDPTAFLKWYPEFKKQLVIESRALAKRRRRERRDRLQQLDDEAASALTALTDAGSPPDLAAYTRWQQAQAAIHQSWRITEDHIRQERRRDRLPLYEQPSPAVTAMLEPRRPAPRIDNLQPPLGGSVITNERKMAGVMGAYTASIYQRQPIDDRALTEMTDAVEAQAPDPSLFDELAKVKVTRADVQAALTRLRTNRATGNDGIAAEVYLANRSLFVPLFARLFTTINQQGRAPAGFTDGLVIYLPKREPEPRETLSPADYRPITLLGSDYKLYSLVLTLRLRDLLLTAIPDAQSAFIPNRRITDNVWLARAVHDHLLARRLDGIAVDLDIAKAYDQVSREALRRLWTALGGQRALFWLSVLCCNTRSRAYVNGFVSPFFHLEAGVRQGCPAAPALYLVIALGLYRLLEKRGLGIDTYGKGQSLHLTVAGQYADDTTAYTRPARLHHLRETMELYRLATGQRINWSKTKIIALGLWPDHTHPHAPAIDIVVLGHQVHLPAIHTLPLDQWRPLNVAVRAAAAQGTPRADEWTRLATGPERVLGNIHRAPQLTMFGRAAAAGAYAYQTSLYHVQLLLPCAPTLARWEQLATNVINGISPTHQGRKIAFSACKHSVLTGTMQTGGFGLLPLQYHVQARLATFGITLVTGNSEWTRVYRATFQHLLGPLHTPFHPLMLCVPPPARLAPLHLPNLTPALDALHNPEATITLALDDLTPGPWCAGVPLWGNPGITNQGLSWRPQDTDPALDLKLLRLDTVGHLILLQRFLERRPIGGTTVQATWIARPLRGPVSLPGRPPITATSLCDPARTLRALTPLRQSIPPPWYAAALAAMEARPTPNAPALRPLPLANNLDGASHILLGALGVRSRAGEITPLADLSVRLLTQLYQAPDRAQKADKITRFITRAAPATPADWPAEKVFTILGRMARIPCPNFLKEPYWLLVYNGVHVSSRYTSAPALQRPCRCGTPGIQSLEHAFWDCPVAQEVRRILEHPLRVCGAITATYQLSRSEVWLSIRPGRVAQWVWDTVTLIAVYAIDQGRRELDAHRPPGTPAASPSSPPGLSPSSALDLALARSRRSFWFGIAQAAQTITLNKQRADALELALAAMGGRHPFFQPSRSASRRVEPCSLCTPLGEV